MSEQDARSGSGANSGKDTGESSAAGPSAGAETAQTTAQERSWKTFIVQEWSLLLLAAAMTLTSWLIVREQIVANHVIEDVWVELAVDHDMRDRLGAVLIGNENKIDVKLSCSEREKNEAVLAMIRNGRKTVTLRVRQEPTGEYRSFNRGDDTYDWPFDSQRILKEFEMPKGSVFKLSRRPVRVEPPLTVRTPEALEKVEGLKVDIVPEQLSVEMNVPIGVFDVPLTPDEVRIDPGEFTLRADGKSYNPRPITLTFENWRERPDGDEWRKAYRAQLRLPSIKAMVTLTQVGSVVVKNRLLIQLPGDDWQVDTSDARDSIDGIVSTLPLAFEGKLRGPKKVLDELEDDEGRTNAGKWSWGLVLKQDPERVFEDPNVKDIKDGEGYVAMSAEIVWLAYADFKNRGVRFAPAPGETDFTVKVRRRPKGP